MAVTSNEPKVIATSRYSINETCELLGITRKTLQKYTMFGLIKCGFRKATMKKFYTGLEYSKVVELVSPKKKGFRLWQ